MVALLLELGVDVHAVSERYVPGITRNGRLTPLGEAACVGAFTCARAITEVVEADESDPPVLTLAAVSGHVDLLLLFLEKWPEASTDEAFTLSTVLGHVTAARMLGRRSLFSWGRRVWKVLWRLGEDRVVEVLSRYPIDRTAAEEIGVPASRLDVCCSPRVLARVSHPTRDLAECVLAWSHPADWESMGSELSERLQRLGVRVVPG
jgi:hypothetical protein